MSLHGPGRPGILLAALLLAAPTPVRAQPATPPPAAPAAAPQGEPRGDFKPLDGVAARINGEVITWNEVRSKMVATALGYDSDPEARQRALVNLAYNKLKELIQDKLLLQLARQEGIEAETEEVEWELEQRRKEHGSVWELTKLLSDQGMNLVDFKRSIREDIQRRKVVQARLRHTPWASRLRRYSIRVSPGEIRAYYVEHREEFRVRACVWLRRVHLLADERGGKDQARALGEAVVRDLRSGMSPAEVDARHKLGCEQFTCPVEALEPIYLDSGLRRKIKDWAFGSPEGAVSDPVALGPGNFAVFVLARKQEEAVRPFEEVQGEIEEALGRDRRSQALNGIMAELYKSADLEPAALRAWLLRTGPQPPLDREIVASILSKPM